MDRDKNPGQNRMQFNSQLENVISAEGEKSLSYMWLHDRSHKIFTRYSNLINIPVIIMSTLAGAASVGSESLFKGFEQASVIIGIVSLIVGILSTLQNYFNFERRAEGHRVSAILYYKVYNFIKIELSLPRQQRTGVADFLKLVKEDLERLKETSPAIPDNVIAEYKKRFDVEEYRDVSRPEICNGLTAIIPYNETIELSGVLRPLTPPPSPTMPSLELPPPAVEHTLPPPPPIISIQKAKPPFK